MMAGLEPLRLLESEIIRGAVSRPRLTESAD